MTSTESAPAARQQTRPLKRSTSFLGILTAVLIAVLVGSAVAQGSAELGGVSVVILCGVVAFGMNWLAFVPAFRARTEHYYDLMGSITYLTVTVFALLAVAEFDGRSVMLSSLIGLWALRLGSFLFRRVRQAGKDGRFDQIKFDGPRFFMMWTIQGLWVYLTLMAALAALAVPEPTPLGVLGILGAVLWAAGFGIEVVADLQKSRFRSDQSRAGSFIDSGLWAWSRHPNYFGEILLWTGIAVIALPTLEGWRWVALISPIFVYVLLTRISGVPMLERRADKRWGGQPDYEEYKGATPALILKPPTR